MPGKPLLVDWHKGVRVSSNTRPSGSNMQATDKAVPSVAIIGVLGVPAVEVMSLLASTAPSGTVSDETGAEVVCPACGT